MDLKNSELFFFWRIGNIIENHFVWPSIFHGRWSDGSLSEFGVILIGRQSVVHFLFWLGCRLWWNIMKLFDKEEGSCIAEQLQPFCCSQRMWVKCQKYSHVFFTALPSFSNDWNPRVEGQNLESNFLLTSKWAVSSLCVEENIWQPVTALLQHTYVTRKVD